MRGQYHRQITEQALGDVFSAGALEEIITANLGQDALKYQVGHDHFHYDSNSFAVADRYCEEQFGLAVRAVRANLPVEARQALGRLTHTVQDFYAHSNYVSLWREQNLLLGAGEIEPQDEGVISSPRLHSGKLYYPLEALSFVGFLRGVVMPFLPRDSHAWMNLDDPTRDGFEYAFWAAVKRTRLIYESVEKSISAQELGVLTGKINSTI